MSRGDIILRLVELTKIYYSPRKVVALNNISTSFKRGEFVAVVGRSGSGKSTLINILGGLDKPTKGDYYCEGNNVSGLNEEHWDALRNKKIGFIFQNYHLIEYLTVYQNVEVALQFQNIPEGMKDAQIRGIIDKVGLTKHINKYPSQLSGGQRQRVAVARALVKDPDIILADEPTGALDWKTADEVIKLLKGESEDRLVIMVTHDRSIANKYANRIIEIEDGEFKRDLIKEEIEQTYQNVFRKIKAVNLRARDKFIMTFNKIKSNLIRNFFIAFSLALAFSFSIIFNGLDRGVRDSYFTFYETLDKTDANAFSVITYEPLNLYNFNQSIKIIETNLEQTGYEVVQGYSRDVILYNNRVYNVENLNQQTDIFNNTKLRLLTTNFNNYAHEDLFIYNSQLPLNPNTLMVTSKFVKEYFNLDSYDDVNKYLRVSIELPNYSVYKHQKLTGVRELLNISYEVNDNFSYEETDVEDITYISFLDIDIPYYCYERNNLNENDLQYCKSLFDNNHKLFTSYDDYIAYMDYFKTQINDTTIFYVLLHSNAIYYFNKIDDPNYIRKVYQYVINELYNPQFLTDGFYLNTKDKTKYTISAIIDNEYEAIIYMTQSNYNRLFKSSNEYTYLSTFYTVNYLDNERERSTNIFQLFSYYSHELRNISLITHDKAESNSICEVDVFADAKTSQNTIFKSVFYVNNYLECGNANMTSSYLNLTNNLFSLFFNILMIASVIFYSMLIRVIFRARINEIGVFRSVGSTIKDIKRLFFYEVLYIFSVASILAFAMLFFVVKFINELFIQITPLKSRVISFSNVHLLLNEQISIINISYINLIVQIVLVVSLILYLSNKNISKVVNTNPIDILREVV